LEPPYTRLLSSVSLKPMPRAYKHGKL